MKILFSIIILLFCASASFAQCNAPNLRGLKLGMTANAVNTLFVVENDLIVFDDVIYQVTFSSNKVVKIVANYYASPEWNNAKEFAEMFSRKTGLPNKWQMLTANAPIKELENELAELLVKYSPEYFKVQQLQAKIKEMESLALPFLDCKTFKVSIEMLELAKPRVTLRLVNQTNSKNFTP